MIILELPGDHLVQAHAYDRRSDDHLRYMMYNTRTQKTKANVTLHPTGLSMFELGFEMFIIRL